MQWKAVGAGAALAWLASKLSVLALEAGRRRSLRAFWWAFGGGMALRAFGLAALAVWSVRACSPSQTSLLLAYVFGLLGFLMFEYRRMIFSKGMD